MTNSEILKFIFAGKASFSLRKELGEYSYMVEWKDVYHSYIVKTFYRNNGSIKNIGFINNGKFTKWTGLQAATVFEWYIQAIKVNDPLADNIEFITFGSCGRCGRKINEGLYGPECAQYMHSDQLELFTQTK